MSDTECGSFHDFSALPVAAYCYVLGIYLGDGSISRARLCLFIMGFPTIGTWYRFLIWVAIGPVIYFFCGRTHGRLARGESGEEAVGGI